MYKIFKYIITGCGRSGTGFFVRMMNNNNIKCGHESYFNILQNNKIMFDAECSWLATPFIDQHVNSNIIRLIRKPELVIKSFLDLGFFESKHVNSPYVKIITDNIEGVDLINKSQIENAIQYYIGWNLLFDKKINNRDYKLIIFEELLTKDKIQLFDMELIVPKGKVNVKKNIKSFDIDIDEINKQIFELGYTDKLNELYYDYVNNTHKIT